MNTAIGTSSPIDTRNTAWNIGCWMLSAKDVFSPSEYLGSGPKPVTTERLMRGISSGLTPM